MKSASFSIFFFFLIFWVIFTQSFNFTITTYIQNSLDHVWPGKKHLRGNCEEKERLRGNGTGGRVEQGRKVWVWGRGDRALEAARSRRGLREVRREGRGGVSRWKTRGCPCNLVVCMRDDIKRLRTKIVLINLLQ